MNDWQAAKERQALRRDVLALVDAQKAVIGALVRRTDRMEREIEALKRWRVSVVTVTKDADRDRGFTNNLRTQA